MTTKKVLYTHKGLHKSRTSQYQFSASGFAPGLPLKSCSGYCTCQEQKSSSILSRSKDEMLMELFNAHRKFPSNMWFPSIGPVAFIMGPDTAHSLPKGSQSEKVTEHQIYVNLMQMKMSNTMKLIVSMHIFWVESRICDDSFFPTLHHIHAHYGEHFRE